MIPELRRIARLGSAYGLHYSKLLDVRKTRYRQVAVCVLGLHRVLTREQREQCNSLDSMVVTDTTFAEMVRYLKHHFDVIPLSAVISERLRVKSSRPSCVLTFDDGWRDNFTNAFPVLREAKMPVSVFLATGFIGTDRIFWIEQTIRACRGPVGQQVLFALSHLLGFEHTVSVPRLIEKLKCMPEKERARILKQVMNEGDERPADEMMSWEEVQELRKQGVDFGAHTVNHPLLTYERDDTVRWELEASKQMIEEKLNTQVTAFAYPNGTWDSRIRTMVESAGYECALTTDCGWHRAGMDRYSIRRVLLHESCVTGVTGHFSPAAFHWTLARAQ